MVISSPDFGSNLDQHCMSMYKSFCFIWHELNILKSIFHSFPSVESKCSWHAWFLWTQWGTRHPFSYGKFSNQKLESAASHNRNNVSAAELKPVGERSWAHYCFMFVVVNQPAPWCSFFKHFQQLRLRHLYYHIIYIQLSFKNRLSILSTRHATVFSKNSTFVLLTKVEAETFP